MTDTQPLKLNILKWSELTGKMGQALFEGDKLRPELMRILESMELRPLGYKIKPNDGVKLLIFRNYESAIAWDIMASYNITIADYTALFYAQWGYESELIHFPIVVETNYPINKDFPAKYEKDFLLNDFEKSIGWCPLCRGNGFMSMLKFDIELEVDGIPSPLVKDVCVHKSIKYKREVLK